MPRRGYVDTRHGQIHYRTAGNGRPLVLLHATPRSSRVFGRLLPILARTHRVVAPDTLGFGESDPLPDPVTMEALAESIADLIDRLELRPAAVFGIHTGNKIGAALAADWPDHVSRFVCCGMTHSIVVEREKRDQAIKDIVARYFDKETVTQDDSHLLRGWARTFQGLSQTWWSEAVVDADPLDDTALSQAALEVLDRIQARASFDAIYRANFGFDLAEALSRVAAPTLVLELATHGEDHLGRQADACVRLLADGRAETFENTDRDILERESEKLADAIYRFVSGR